MTAEEIRKFNIEDESFHSNEENHADYKQRFLLREIAAQLAEINKKLTAGISENHSG